MMKTFKEYTQLNEGDTTAAYDMEKVIVSAAGGPKFKSKLIKNSDVLIENSRVGTMDKLGFGYKDVKKINPKVIYCSITGFGTDGPYAKRGGFDLIAQGMSGLMSITGHPD